MRRELAGVSIASRIFHQRMWRTMRARREGFRVAELIAICEVPRKTAEKFLRGLTRGGYLRAERGGPARRYALVRDTGPAAPRVSRDGRGVALDANEEIARERIRHAELVRTVRSCEARMRRLGAYVAAFEPETIAQSEREGASE